MSIDFRTFNEIAPLVLKSKLPVLLRGRHGVGKSQVVYQVANRLDLPVVERRASQMTEGDLLGVPSPEGMDINGEQASKFRPFDWLVQACTEPVVLFFDEIDRATIEVRQGIFELTDSRKLAGWNLHEDTVICAAINGGNHGAQYQVGEMDPAELDRWTTFDIEPSVEDWLDWGRDNVNELVWDFINNNRDHLEHGDDFEPNKVYPSRRSWDRLDKTLQLAGLYDDPTSQAVFNLSSAFIGFEAAVAFADYVKNREKIVQPHEIIDEGRIELTKDFGINDHIALVDKMDADSCFKEELEEDQLKNIAGYFNSLPSEVAMKLWHCLSRHSPANTIGIHGLIQDQLILILADIDQITLDNEEGEEQDG